MRTDNLLCFLAIQSTAFHLPPVFNVICADAQCSFPRKTVPVWTPKGDVTAPASSEVTESLCRSLCCYIEENCWSFFACCLSDVALGARRWRTMFRNNTGYRSNKLCLHQYALELKTKPGWRSAGLDAGLPKQHLLPYFMYSFLYQSVQYLHPLAGSCHSCRWQMALHSGIIRDATEKGGGKQLC